MTFDFDPPDGYRNIARFPTTPASEADFRDAMQSLLDQLRDEMNRFGALGAGVQAMLRQAIINGNFDVWQRGTTFNTAPGVYTADRWVTSNNVDNNVKIMQSASVPNKKSKYSLRAEQTIAVGSAGADALLLQYIEDYQLLRGQKITFSGFVKCDAGVKVTPRIDDGVSATDGAEITSAAWTYFSVTKTIDNTAARLFPALKLDRNNLAIGLGANYAQLMINVGDVALPFQPHSFAEELALCQRYYEVIDFSYGQSASANGTTACYSGVRFATKKRIAPTISMQSTNGTNGQLAWQSAGVSSESVASNSTANTVDGCTVGTTATTAARNWVAGKVFADAEL